MNIFRILMLFFAEPDTDEPQPMGEDSGEVDLSEEAMDKFNDKRSEAMSAFSDGDFQVWPLLLTQLFGCLLVFFLKNITVSFCFKKFKFFELNLAAGSL